MFPESMIPYWIMRKFTMELLAALEFAHDHNVIHTGALSLTVLAVVMLNILTDKRADIKPDNIFVKFRDTSLIESGYLVDVPIPQQDRSEERYSIAPATSLGGYYFDEEEPRQILDLDIALGDWGVSSWTTQHLTERIQPVALRAPEVLIQAPWDETTDWWNLGAVVFELYCAVRMFDGRVRPTAITKSNSTWPRWWPFSAHSPKSCCKKGIRISFKASSMRKESSGISLL
jgi:serine/threonine-protein kinase SRPK3